MNTCNVFKWVSLGDWTLSAKLYGITYRASFRKNLIMRQDELVIR